MGVIGNFLADRAGDIGELIDKAFGGSGKTGRTVGGASSGLIRLLPFEKGGYVVSTPTARNALVVKVPTLEKGGRVQRKKKNVKRK
jgi:hypothetical protein